MTPSWKGGARRAVRRPWALAYSLWGVVVVAWTMLLIVHLPDSHAFLPKPVIAVTGLIVDGTAVVLFVGRRREKTRLEVAAATAADADVASKWTVRVADPAPNQCPVCGLDDLAWWREVDVFTLREGSERHVQPYGPYQAAHRFCAELVPYMAPPAEALPRVTVAASRGAVARSLGPDDRVREEMEPPFYSCSCRKCGEIGHAKTITGRDAILEAHRRACWKIPQIEVRDKSLG